MSSNAYLRGGLLSIALAWLALPSLADSLGGPGPAAGGTLASQGLAAESVSTPLKLINTYVSNGAGGSLAAFTFNFVESRTVNCPNLGGCHIGQESMVQLTTTGNWAICLSVDGIQTTCQYQGNLPDTGPYVVGNARGISGTVRQGLHTVKTEVYTDVASSLIRWQTDHRVYRP
jgi:hypothetical protein